MSLKRYICSRPKRDTEEDGYMRDLAKAARGRVVHEKWLKTGIGGEGENPSGERRDMRWLKRAEELVLYTVLRL